MDSTLKADFIMRVAMQFMAQNLSDEPVATEEEYLALVHHYLQGVEPGAHVHAFLIVMDSVLQKLECTGA